MAKSVYYIYRVSCKVSNKKTRELSKIVSRYNRTLIEFDDEGDFTPQSMFQCFQNYMAGLNQNYKGLEVSVRMSQFDGVIQFAFTVPNKGDAIASIALCPVNNHIDCEEAL